MIMDGGVPQAIFKEVFSPLFKDISSLVEALWILQGFIQLWKRGILQARVIGDSQSLIKIMVRKKKSIDIKLRHNVLRIKETA